MEPKYGRCDGIHLVEGEVQPVRQDVLWHHAFCTKTAESNGPKISM